MAAKGQSSNPLAQSYHPQGLPLEAGVSELITKASSDTGQRHELIWDVYTQAWQAGSANIGKVVVFSWPGEHPGNAPAPSIATHANTVRWMKAIDWLPFQRKTFNTPAFPGYISGHSTFSAAAATVLARFFGTDAVPFSVGSDSVPGVTRSYTSFAAAAGPRKLNVPPARLSAVASVLVPPPATS